MRPLPQHVVRRHVTAAKRNQPPPPPGTAVFGFGNIAQNNGDGSVQVSMAGETGDTWATRMHDPAWTPTEGDRVLAMKQGSNPWHVLHAVAGPNNQPQNDGGS